MSHVRHRPAPRIKSIKFRATFPQVESYGLHKVKEVVFALGLGPCGKHVLRLEHTVTEDLLTIIQTSRDPDDLDEPGNWSAQYKLERHHEAQRRMARDQPVTRVYFPEYRVTGFLWWKKTEEIKPEPLPEIAPPEGLLEPAEVAALQEELQDLYATHAAWLNRREVKTFVYKMSDVHGRIEVIQ